MSNHTVGGSSSSCLLILDTWILRGKQCLQGMTVGGQQQWPLLVLILLRWSFFFFLQKCWDELSFVQLPEVKKYILIITVGVYITIIVFVLKQLIYWVSIEIHRCLFLRNTKCLEIISNCQININFENAHTETNKNKKKQQSQLQVLRKHCFELMVYSVKVMNVWFSFSIQLGEFLVVYTLRWKLPSRERALDTADASLEVIAAKGSTKKHF